MPARPSCSTCSTTPRGSSEQSVLSDRGSVIVDERTNAIILTDTADRLQEFRKVISQLDIPVRQVLIEARIVTAIRQSSPKIWVSAGVALKSISSQWLHAISSSYGGSLHDPERIAGHHFVDPSGTPGEISSPENLFVDLGCHQGRRPSSFGVGITGAGLHPRPGAVCSGGGWPCGSGCPTEGDHGRQITGLDRIRYGDSLSGSNAVQRCDLDVVQGRVPWRWK